MEANTIYPTDLRDEHWNLLRPLLPPRSPIGRPPAQRRRIVNAVLYLLRAGCAWRMLPKAYGPWSTVHGVFRGWVKESVWERVHNALRTRVREADGLRPSPTAAILDSQTVKVGEQGGVRGYDAGKKTAGRKRHILVDVLGLLLGVYVGSAEEQDRDGAKTLLPRFIYWYGRLAHIWADAGYTGALVAWVKALRPRGRLHLDIVRRSDGAKGFQLLHRRWIVERTPGWFVKQRRLVRDYEARTEHSEALL